MKRLELNPPEFGQLVQLASDVFWARFALPFRLDHINLYILDQGDHWLLIDCGLDNEITAAHWTALLDGPLAGKPVGGILVTHHHVDHVGYAGALAGRTGAPVMMSADEAAHAHWFCDLNRDEFSALMTEVYTSYGLDAATIAIGRDDPDRYRRHVSPLPPFAVIRAGDVITSRDGAWEARIDAGHSSAHVSLFDRGRNIYLAVDFLLPRISPNVAADFRDLNQDQLGLYLDYLAAISRELTPDTLVLPGHDWPFQGGDSRAADLIAHHHERLDLLRGLAVAGPVTTATAMDELFGKVFGPHEVYFAAGEARAHLNHLVATGDFERDRHGGVDRFSLAGQ